ncbi:MAG: prepilin-type N-terminal cleavage/methylation domain-containing protein [Candidatus Riflebacteria bacterium]|nr:prepilin-type N-terminal cleavage/methylation domain-containing protein [Candidatus Riflebacteria bacterium]
MKKNAFTLVETLVAVVIMLFILVFGYRLFFSQTKAVTRSIESIQVNEGFRKVLAFMGDDIKEATNIISPIPVFPEEVKSLTTKSGTVLVVQSSELDPRIRFDSPLGGQTSLKRTVTYTLDESYQAAADGNPVYKLIRFEMIEEKNGTKSTQRQALADNIREFVIYRTVRKPYTPVDVSSLKDRIVMPMPLNQSGTGNNLVNLKMVIERERDSNETGDVYKVKMETGFYKRGKEIFINP